RGIGIDPADREVIFTLPPDRPVLHPTIRRGRSRAVPGARPGPGPGGLDRGRERSGKGQHVHRDDPGRGGSGGRAGVGGDGPRSRIAQPPRVSLAVRPRALQAPARNEATLGTRVGIASKSAPWLSNVLFLAFGSTPERMRPSSAGWISSPSMQIR